MRGTDGRMSNTARTKQEKIQVCRNFQTWVWTNSVQRPRRCTNFSVVFSTVTSACRYATSVRCLEKHWPRDTNGQWRIGNDHVGRVSGSSAVGKRIWRWNITSPSRTQNLPCSRPRAIEHEGCPLRRSEAIRHYYKVQEVKLLSIMTSCLYIHTSANISCFP